MAYYHSVKRKLAEAGWKNAVHRRRDLTPHEMFEYRRVPMPRLIDKLGLAPYRSHKAPLDEHEWQPREVRIPLKQHAGIPAIPAVKAGSRMRRGDLVASIPDGELGADVHASVSGRVAEVTAQYITIESG